MFFTLLYDHSGINSDVYCIKHSTFGMFRDVNFIIFSLKQLSIMAKR